MRAKDDRSTPEHNPGGRPLLMVDIDGVISLFGSPGDSAHPSRDPAGASREAPAHDASHTRARGSLHSIDGIPHFLSATAAEHLLALWPVFELVWASGWEEKANEYLPHLLGLPAPLPYLSFERGVGGTRYTKAHWKLDSIDAYAGVRPLAWIDDVFNEACHAWARTRAAPTLLVQTTPEQGLTDLELEQLLAFADTYPSGSSGTSRSPSPSTKPGSEPPAPIFSREARSASNSRP